MKKKILSVLLCLSMSLPVLAAKLEGNVNKQIAPVQEQELTVGTVQKYVHVGQAQDEVAIALGSPNIVTQDENGKETWIYDKMASSITDRNKNESVIENAMDTRYFWHGVLTLATLGLINKDVKPELKDISQVVSTQKTLTIVIKFDKTNKVESFTYHMSKF
jgi:outer membrane protein assembly factor BamE (lipoprotein component of BamABCDE complex)